MNANYQTSTAKQAIAFISDSDAHTGAGQQKMVRKSPIMLLQQKCNAAPWRTTAQQLLSPIRKHIFVSFYTGCRSFSTASFRPTTCTVSQNECDTFRRKFSKFCRWQKHCREEGRKQRRSAPNKKKKIACLGVLFLFARLHVARALAVPRRESSVQSKLTRALWDTAADCARSLDTFFLPKGEGWRQ